MRRAAVSATATGIDPGTGIMAAARQVPSPNCDPRPPGATPDLIVVHGISLPPDEFGGPWIERLFTNMLPPDQHPYFAQVAALKVSAHLLIRRDGELVQYVPFHLRAWHAGASAWRYRVACNDFSIGIELEGSDERPYEEVQYRRLAAAIDALQATYATLAPDAIVGHSDIAPGRKSDPGVAFDWPKLQTLLVLARQDRRR